MRLSYLYWAAFETQSKSCRSSCLESQIIKIKLKKNQQKVCGPTPMLSASDLYHVYWNRALEYLWLDLVVAYRWAYQAGLCIRAYLAWSMNHLFNAVCITQQLSILSPPSVPNLHFWYNFCPSALWGGGVLFRFNSSRPLGRYLKFGDNRNGPIYPRVISFDKVKLYYHLQASSHIIWSLSSLIFSEIFLLSLYISFHISL